MSGFARAALLSSLGYYFKIEVAAVPDVPAAVPRLVYFQAGSSQSERDMPL